MTVETRLHLIHYLPVFLLWAFTSVFAATAAGVIAIFTDTNATFTALLICLGIALLSALQLVRKFLIWRFHIVTVASDAIVIRHGLLSTRTDRIDLTAASISVSQTLSDRMLDKGSLQLVLISGRRETISQLPNFRQICNLIDCQNRLALSTP